MSLTGCQVLVVEYRRLPYCWYSGVGVRHLTRATRFGDDFTSQCNAQLAVHKLPSLSFSCAVFSPIVNMKAARLYGPGDIRVEDIAEPIPAEGQVKVKIAWNGICGSDLHAYLGPVPKYATSIPNEITGETLPVTLGHEFAGTIVGLGPKVDESKWRVGTNVAIEPVISCMKTSVCFACASGSRNLCPASNFIGICGWGGGLSEFIAVDVRYLHVLPGNVPLEIGACMEPLAVAWYAIKRSGFTKGQSVLILGAGPIGIFLLKILRSFDPSATIVTSEPALLRRQQALKHGATHVFDPLDMDVPEAVMKATRGVGVDVAFDAAGVQGSIDAAMQSVRPRGTIVNVAIWEKSASVNMNIIVMKEIHLTGTLAYDRVHPELLEAVAAEKIPGLEELITSKIALEDVVEKGFRALLDDKDAQIKILVHP
ncbi:putative alcohol dehydrogenase GroES-like domain [Lyophyllum shimeji]|uniref:Alcohol dehydrogenase GroES-like domain n=1 Tax=Lyophyllum shimeji TaxID=47721 RepID=A0A9P3UQ20_LYOSH|nr:putative alcohol dehydrogenase GroES-like domain [Lyophyllum shimeji]